MVAVAEGGPAALIENRHTGMLCRPDADHLAGAVLQLASSPLLRRHLGASAARAARAAPGSGRWSSSRPATPRASATPPSRASGRSSPGWPEAAGAPAMPQYDGPIDDPALYFNRELSWLDFNQRVLELAEEPGVPLLERLRFCAIYASNLDEFFMVRVAGLFDQLDAGIDARGPDGLAPERADRRDPGARARARPPPARLLRRDAAPGAGGARDQDRLAGDAPARRSGARSTAASTSRSSRR